MNSIKLREREREMKTKATHNAREKKEETIDKK